MLRKIPALIEHCSSIMCFDEGDLLLTGVSERRSRAPSVILTDLTCLYDSPGTPAGVGFVNVGDKISAGLEQDGASKKTTAAYRGLILSHLYREDIVHYRTLGTKSQRRLPLQAVRCWSCVQHFFARRVTGDAQFRGCICQTRARASLEEVMSMHFSSPFFLSPFFLHPFLVADQSQRVIGGISQLVTPFATSQKPHLTRATAGSASSGL